MNHATFLPALLGALVGAAAALLAQLISHRFASRRESDAAVRAMSAAMLGQGRAIQAYIKRSRREDRLETAGLDRAIVPFVSANYELQWTGPEAVGKAAEDFADATNELVNIWREQRPGGVFLDQEMVNTAQALENAVKELLRRPNDLQRLGQWVLDKSGRNARS